MVEGYFDCRAGLPGRHQQRGRLVRDRADAGAGQAAETIRVEGRPQLRSRRRRPGRGGQVLGNAGRGGIPGERRDAAGRRRSRYTSSGRQGGAAYQEQLRQSQPVSGLSAGSGGGRTTICERDEDRREFLSRMLTVAARIPDAAARDQFADRLAHKARITEEVVRAEIRKAAVQKRDRWSSAAARARRSARSKTVERGLIWALMRDPAAGFGGAGRAWKTTDLSGLATGPILRTGAIPAGMAAGRPYRRRLLERLSRGEAALVAEIGRPVRPARAGPRRLRPGVRSACGSTGNAPPSSARSTGSRSRARQQRRAEINALWDAEAGAASSRSSRCMEAGQSAGMIWSAAGARNEAAEFRRTRRCRSKKNTMR